MLSAQELFQLIKKLQADQKERSLNNSFVIEGQKVVFEFLMQNIPLRYLIFDKKRIECDTNLASILSLAERQGIPCLLIRKARFAGLSTVKTPQGVIAVVSLKKYSLKNILKKESVLIAVGDNIQNPINAGILVRNSIAFGLDMLIFTKNSVDVFSPKALRTASGCIVELPIFYLTDNDLVALKQEGVRFYSSVLGVKRPLSSIRAVSKKTALVFGNEGEGISDRLKMESDILFHIPISQKIDSLNITSAAAVIMYHFAGLKSR